MTDETKRSSPLVILIGLVIALGAAELKVDVRSLHAGTQCCETLPALHYQEPGYPYKQGTPAFQEDIVIPWEGKRLLDAVKSALPKLKAGEPVIIGTHFSRKASMSASADAPPVWFLHG